MRSLRRGAVLAGSIWALMTILLGTLAVLSIFNGIAERRFNALLEERHLQVVTALANAGGRPDLVAQILVDPVYQRPLSGRYWQVREPDGSLTTSASLFDEILSGHKDMEHGFWEGDMAGDPIRGLGQVITLDDGSDWHVSVAASLTALQKERAEVRRNVIVAFGVVGILVVIGAIFLTSSALRPLSKLREDVTHRWDDDDGLRPDDYPQEVAPLVKDINALLERNQETIRRARRQAADMAHALKTPSSALRNELQKLGETGAAMEGAVDALDRIDAQLNRSLARIQATHGATTPGAKVNLNETAARLERLFNRMNRDTGKTLQVTSAPNLVASMDPQDAEELLGNLLENAFKWSQSQVRLSGSGSGRWVTLTIEDDGPGIPATDRKKALLEGGRLDTKAPGTGLGLAIALDLLEAYGGSMTLDASDDLGGLKATVVLPRGRRVLGADNCSRRQRLAEVS